ncbi:hypothetical protein DL766_006346 [Monosporascus sp. MC13-8B]|uniref:MobA-like NTP transferase domain-containing protein n=1 Tax=Monosporascus cannonballus TaxID=155416 RepID=A0ABY0GRA4_9PEZI|nr:hypothetical protein DL762_010563 [Monosporascus cannonballus]RYO95133.1 hypothetical protein DL763_003831 [Monosporascus cannonballus]RYP27509.1 hypothetical protein DL766_006346 [Monosporascus sp. MC13-8B]
MHPLILAGGRSTRMGSPKHLLELPNGKPLYQHQADILRTVLPGSKVYISLAQESPLDETLRSARGYSDDDIASCGSGNGELRVVFDSNVNSSAESKGPAEGLLSAYNACPDATWLVVACDYPYVSSAMPQHLMASYNPPVACFRNSEGFCEPLLGIWSPAALKRLAENVTRGKSGPAATVRELNGIMLSVPEGCEAWLVDVNRQADWEAALEKLAASV